MKKISITIVLALIISTITSVPFASMAAISGDPYTDNPLCIFSYDGTGSPTGVPALDVSSGTVTPTPLNVGLNLVSGKKHSDGTAMSTSIASYVESAPQKAETDKTLHMNIVGTTATGTYNSPAFIINASPLIKGSTAYEYLTYEFDALFCTDTSSVSVRWNKDYSANLLASTNAIGYSGLTYSANLSTAYKGVELNKWHKVRFVFPIGNTSDKIKIYLDNMSTPVATTSADVSGSSINGSSISSTAAHYEMAFSVADGKVQDTYVDNINIYVGSARSNSFSAPSASAADDDAVMFDGNNIVCKSLNMTAKEVIDALNITGAVYSKVYRGVKELADSEAISGGEQLVLASSDGVYAYYSIKRPQDVIESKGVYDGSDSTKVFGGSLNKGNAASAVSEISAAPHKSESDLAYKVTITNTSDLGSGTQVSLDPWMGNVYGTATPYKNVIVEFDYMPVSGEFSYGMRVGNNANSGWCAFSLATSSVAAKVNNAPASHSVIVDRNKWHHIAYEFNHDGVGTTARLYVDGEDKGTATVTAGSKFTANSAFGSSGVVFANANANPVFYIDNVNYQYSNVSGIGYQNTKAAPVITGRGDVLKEYNNTSRTVSVANGSALTADALVSAIKTNAVYKAVYKSDDLLTAREGAVAEGDILVLESADGVYSYYTINFMDVSALYEDAGNITVTSTGDNASATADGKAVVISSKESANYPFAAKATFASPMDISSLGNVYTVSFDVKHEFTDNVTSGMYVGDKYLAEIQFEIDGKQQKVLAIYGQGNGLKVGGVGSQTGYGYNGKIENLDNGRIHGMNLGEAYRFQFVVDKNNKKLYFVINDQYIADVSNYYTTFTGSAVKGLTVNMRGGSGTVEYVKLTLGNFKAVSGFGDLQIKNPEISVSGVNAFVQYDAVNLTGAAYATKLIAAAYDNNGILIASKVADVALADGYNLSVQQNIAFDESTSASAKSYRAFFINSFDDLKPLGSSDVYTVD